MIKCFLFQPCDKPFDSRSEQCSDFDSVPYSEQLLKWYPYYDPSRPCALICRGEQPNSSNAAVVETAASAAEQIRALKERLLSSAEEYESDESIVVQLAEKVQDGTRCYPDSQDVCINGECMVSYSYIYLSIIRIFIIYLLRFIYLGRVLLRIHARQSFVRSLSLSYLALFNYSR